MRSTAFLFVLTLGAGCAATVTTPTCPDQNLEADLPPGSTQVVKRAAEIVWGPCPPSLPPQCEMAVLEGDPRSETLFTARFRINSAFELKPHYHARHERATVLEGKIGVGFGDEIDRSQVTWFGPGDYYVNAKSAHHFVLADEPVVVQITGIGPWSVNYLDP